MSQGYVFHNFISLYFTTLGLNILLILQCFMPFPMLLQVLSSFWKSEKRQEETGDLRKENGIFLLHFLGLLNPPESYSLSVSEDCLASPGNA